VNDIRESTPPDVVCMDAVERNGSLLKIGANKLTYHGLDENEDPVSGTAYIVISKNTKPNEKPWRMTLLDEDKNVLVHFPMDDPDEWKTWKGDMEHQVLVHEIQDYINPYAHYWTSQSIIPEEKMEFRESSESDYETLYHGTTSDRNITEFHLKKANWGVGANAYAQGDIGIYLTNSINAARYFSRKAGEFDILMSKEGRSMELQQGIDAAWDKLFGPDDGNVIEVRISKNLNLKMFDKYPSRDAARNALNEDFDGIRFREAGFDNLQDFPYKVLEDDGVWESMTTVIFDPKNIEVVRNNITKGDVENK